MIALEGNIGVGKTTVLRELQRRGVRVAFEAVEHWTLLRPFYTQPQRFGFALQTQVLASYAATPPDTQIVERSVATAMNVFVPIAVANGNITQYERAQLQTLTEMLPLPNVSRFVYLRAPSDLCFRRISWRNREGEEHIRLGYLENLQNRYDRFFDTVPDNQRVIIDVFEQDTPAMIADRIQHELQLNP